MGSTKVISTKILGFQLKTFVDFSLILDFLVPNRSWPWNCFPQLNGEGIKGVCVHLGLKTWGKSGI